jgi:H+/Cl- antiporter ClcA
MNQPGKRKWSLWRAALLGLVIAVCLLAINSVADRGKELSIRLHAPPAEMTGYFMGRLLLLPILLVLIAFIRNFFIKERAPT